jgi:hypothetical protein
VSQGVPRPVGSQTADLRGSPRLVRRTNLTTCEGARSGPGLTSSGRTGHKLIHLPST